MMLRDSLADLQNAEQILAKDKRLASASRARAPVLLVTGFWSQILLCPAVQ